MTMEVDTAKMEQQEIDGIDALLYTLWQNKLLTDFDCRIIALSNNTLMEKKAAVYTVIMSKSKDEAAILTEAFREMTVEVQAKEKLIRLHNDTNINNEGNTSTVLLPRNPFLNNLIITHLFGFLSLEDMKRSRLVCHEWNYAAETCLRKRAAVHFRRDVILPQTFMEVYKYSLPDVAFPSFVFSNDGKDDDSNWQISKIEDFFEKYGKNIKELTFNYVSLTTKCNLTDREVLISDYDLTPLFINLSNITSLKIQYPIEDPYSDDNPVGQDTKFDISLEKFVSIKNLSVHYCRLIVSAENTGTRIAPISVDFKNVDFIQNGEYVTNLHYNDLVDFSKALNINLYSSWYHKSDLKFDMTKQVLIVKQLHLSNVDHENWCQAKGDVQFLRLYKNQFLERNHLKIKQLETYNSKIDLSALPETLETLKCVKSTIFCSKELYLPNLKYLFLPGKFIDNFACFSNCPLVDLAIINKSSSCPHKLNLSLVPKSVKRLKLQRTNAEFTGNCSFQLDTLILIDMVNMLLFKYGTDIIARMKAKVLVLVCNSAHSTDTSYIVQLVQANNDSEKILFGSYFDLHKDTPFEGSELSEYVDKESNFYQFENKVGKSITEAHFEEYAKMKVYSPPYFYYKK